MRPISSSFGVVAVVICAQHVTLAQFTTSATCSSSFDWASTQQGQSPCLVAAYVMGACSSIGIKEVYALSNPNNFYLAPFNPLTECGCSMANYNLLSACTACQEGIPARYPYWMTNCTSAGINDTSTYYPTSKWPIPDGVQIPLWAQQDASLWTNMHFNSTEAQEIATSGKLIGPPLGSSSTTSATTNPSSSLSSTISTLTVLTSAPIDSKANVGPIVGGVVGGVLGLLLIGVLIWWILRQRRPSYEGASPSMSAMPFAGSKQPSPGVMVQHAPGVLDHNGALISHHYTTAGVGLPSNAPQRMGSSSPPSMIARFVTPYTLPPVSQGAGTSPGDSTSHLQAVTKPHFNPPGYTPPEAAIPSLPQPNPAVQAHMTPPFNTDLGRMITATPRPMSPETPNPPSYTVSQAESREEQLRRAVSVATAGTLASSSNVLPPLSTPERRGNLLPTVPERVASPRDGSG